MGSRVAGLLGQWLHGPPLTQPRLDVKRLARLRFRISGAKHKYSIPHTVSAPVKLAKVQKSLATLFDWQDAFERARRSGCSTPR